MSRRVHRQILANRLISQFIASFNVNKLFILPTHSIYGFRRAVTIITEYFPTQRWPVVLHNEYSMCSLQGKECFCCIVKFQASNLIMSDPKPVHVRFLVDKVALGQISLQVLRFSPVSFHQCFILIGIYMLLLPEGQMGQAWEPSKKQCFFQKSDSIKYKPCVRDSKCPVWCSNLFLLLYKFLITGHSCAMLLQLKI
jgi:hypothetical protein